MTLTLESVLMREVDFTRKPPVLDTVDTFLAAVPWTKHRTVIIYLREHGGRRYVRLRTFNRHREKGCWYPSPRFYMVPIECAATLGKAIIAAAEGRRLGPEPDWYRDFEKQYAALRRAKPRASESAPAVEPDTEA